MDSVMYSGKKLSLTGDQVAYGLKNESIKRRMLKEAVRIALFDKQGSGRRTTRRRCMLDETSNLLSGRRLMYRFKADGRPVYWGV